MILRQVKYGGHIECFCGCGGFVSRDIFKSKGIKSHLSSTGIFWPLNLPLFILGRYVIMILKLYKVMH